MGYVCANHIPCPETTVYFVAYNSNFLTGKIFSKVLIVCFLAGIVDNYYFVSAIRQVFVYTVNAV